MNFKAFLPTKKPKVLYSLIAIASTFFIIAAKYQLPQSMHIVPARYSAYKAIIFDAGDVLFTTSSKAKASLILSTMIANPSLILKAPTMDIKEQFFKILETVPAQTIAPIYNKGKKMPQIMADFMVGEALDEIQLKVKRAINNCNYAGGVKNLMHAVAQLVFNPEKLGKSQVPIKATVDLAKTLKNHGYKLYILSNWDAQSFEIVRSRHPEIFDLFDGIMVSGEHGLVKPQPEFYEKLLERFNLNRNECLFIDDEAFNTKAAETLGIRSIVCTDIASVCKDLIRAGVMTIK